MKHSIYVSVFVLGLLSCSQPTREKIVTERTIDTVQAPSSNSHKTNIFIKDKSQYNQTFIDGLSEYNEPIKLIDSIIIVGHDTTNFPNDLPLNKKVTFQGVKNNNKFVLEVTRANLTNLHYDFQVMNKDNQILENKSGKAILASMFFLASEVDEDTQTGDGYGSSEYWDKNNDCWFSIRIGIGRDNKGKRRAIPTVGCEDKTKQTLDLDGCPTLRTE